MEKTLVNCDYCRESLNNGRNSGIKVEELCKKRKDFCNWECIHHWLTDQRNILEGSSLREID